MLASLENIQDTLLKDPRLKEEGLKKQGKFNSLPFFSLFIKAFLLPP
jgi:hypothetical protein